MSKQISIALLGVLSVAVADSTLAGPTACERRANNTSAKLLECVTLTGVREHQAEFQAIADAHSGIRTSGAPGYDASKDYVVSRMTAAGYQVTVQSFHSKPSSRCRLASWSRWRRRRPARLRTAFFRIREAAM